jgi:hypothetical protein
MLIKLRFIGLLFILLLSTSASGQSYQTMSLQELMEDQNYWQNVVSETDWDFFKVYDKFGRVNENAPPVFLPRSEGRRIWLEATFGKDCWTYDSNGKQVVDIAKIAQTYNASHEDINNKLAAQRIAMSEYSSGIKSWHRFNTIPKIEDAIRNHPDNQYNPDNLVNNDEWWYCPDYDGDPTLVLREDCIEYYMGMRKADQHGLSKYTAHELIAKLRLYSDNRKQEILHHPDNPNNPLNPYDPNIDPYIPEPEPTPATHCHSIGPAGDGFMIGDRQLGNHCMYHQNGRLSHEVPYAHGVRHGTERTYFDSGEKREERTYWNGELNGKQFTWYRNGNYSSTKNFEDGKSRGEYRTYYEDGRPTACFTYHSNGKRTKCPL